MLRLAGDDEAARLRVGDDLGVGRIGVLLVLPLVLVELRDERLEALHVGRGADLEGPGLASCRGPGVADLEAGDEVLDQLQVLGARADEQASGLAVADDLGVGDAGPRAAGDLVLVELLEQGQHALRLGELAEVKRLGLARRRCLALHGRHDLADGRRLFLGAVDQQAGAGGVRVDGRGLDGLALGLLGVDLADLWEQVCRGRVLQVDRMELADALVGVRVERGDHGGDLGEGGGRGEDEQPLAGGLGRDAEQAADVPAGVLRGEDLLHRGRERVGVALHVEDAEHAFLAGGFAVELLDDGLDVLQVGAVAGDDERVGFLVGGDGDALDGLAARVEAHHRVGDDGSHHRRLGQVELEDAGAGRLLRGVVEAVDEGDDLLDLGVAASDDEAVGQGVGHDLGRGDVIGAALVLHQLGEEVADHRRHGRGIGGLELDDAQLARAGFPAGVELLDHLPRGLDCGAFAGDHEAVAAGVEQHADLLGLRVEALLDQAGDLRGGGGLEADDAGLFLRPLGRDGVELADDGLDPGDLLLTAADHDAVVLGLGDQRRRAAGGLGLPADLFLVELLDQRRELGGGAAVDLDAAELPRCGGRGRDVELLHQGPHPFQVLGDGEHDDLLAGRVGHQGRRELAGRGELSDELRDQRDDLRRGLHLERDDAELALGLRRGDVDHGDGVLDLLQLLVGRGDEDAVVRRVGDERGLGQGGEPPVGHPLGDEALDAGQRGLGACVLQDHHPEVARQALRPVGAELLHQRLDAGEVVLARGDDEAAGSGVGEDLGVRDRAGRAIGRLVAVELVDQRLDALGLLRRPDIDEARLQRRRLRRAGLDLRDDVGRRLEIRRRTGHHDALAAGVEAHAGGGGDLAGAVPPGQRLADDAGHVGRAGGARPEDLRELDRLRARRHQRVLAVLPDGALDAFVHACHQLLDLVELAGEGRGDDDAVEREVGDDAGLGGGGGGGFVGGGDAGDGLADQVRQLVRFHRLRVVDADVAGRTFLLLELVHQLLGQRQAFRRPEEQQGPRGVVVHRGHVVGGIRRQDLHGLGVRVEGGPLRRGGDAEGAVEQVRDDGARGVLQRVGLHLAVGGLAGADGGEQRADALDVREAVGDDEAATARERCDGTGAREHRQDGIGDLLGLQVGDVEHDGDDLARSHVAGVLGASHDADGHRRELLERDEPQVVAVLEQHHALHGEHEVQRVERLVVGVGVRIVVGERADDIGVGEQRTSGHLREPFDDVGVRDAVELEADVAGRRGLGADDDVGLRRRGLRGRRRGRRGRVGRGRPGGVLRAEREAGQQAGTEEDRSDGFHGLEEERGFAAAGASPGGSSEGSSRRFSARVRPRSIA